MCAEVVQDDDGPRLQDWGDLGLDVGGKCVPVHGTGNDPRGAIRESAVRPAMKVWVLHLPKGAAALRR